MSSLAERLLNESDEEISGYVITKPVRVRSGKSHNGSTVVELRAIMGQSAQILVLDHTVAKKLATDLSVLL